MAKKDSLAERHQVILADLLRDEENKYCADCGAKGPRWASWNLGVFLCIRCAGIHRNLGVHISRVKSVNLDSWTPEQIEAIRTGGNRRAAEKYEATLPSDFKRPSADSGMENFIRSKYERKLYVDKSKPKEKKEQLPAPSSSNKPKVRKESKKGVETMEPVKAKKSSKLVALPRPQPSPKASKSISMSEIEKKSSAPAVDLLSGNDVPLAHHSKSSQNIDLLTSDPSAQPAAVGSQVQPKQDLFSFNESNPSQTQGPKIATNDIMSLYSNAQSQSSYSPYTTTPMQAMYYQQQQAAALKMAQQYQQQQMQVYAVQQQMANLKVQQSQTQMNGYLMGHQQPPTTMTPGQTMNPDLW